MDKDIRYKEMIGYLKESKEFIFINIVTMVFISAFLVSEDLPIIDIFLIIVVWICLLFGFFIINYLKRQRYHKKIEKMLDELDKNQRIIAGNAQFAGIAAGRGVRFTTGLLLLGKGLGMRETPIRPHSWH